MKVAELMGTDLENWSENKWKKTIQENDILVGTPEVFRNAFVDRNYFSPALFSLLVFDEVRGVVDYIVVYVVYGFNYEFIFLYLCIHCDIMF